MPLPCLAPATRMAALFAAATLSACSKQPPEHPAPPPAPAPSPDAPPAMVGVWTSTRGAVMRCIELHADGVYVMVPNAEAGDHATWHGTWSVGDTQISWRDASRNYDADVNRMVDVSDGHFTTIEADQSQTRFDRIAGPGATCPR